METVASFVPRTASRGRRSAGNACTRRATVAMTVRFGTYGSWYVCEAILEGLAQPLEDVAAKLRQFIEKENPMVRQRHVARQRHLAAPDQPHIRDRVMRGAIRARGDDGGAVAGALDDARDARGLHGFAQGYGRRVVTPRAVTLQAMILGEPLQTTRIHTEVRLPRVSIVYTLCPLWFAFFTHILAWLGLLRWPERPHSYGGLLQRGHS